MKKVHSLVLYAAILFCFSCTGKKEQSHFLDTVVFSTDDYYNAFKRQSSYYLGLLRAKSKQGEEFDNKARDLLQKAIEVENISEQFIRAINQVSTTPPVSKRESGEMIKYLRNSYGYYIEQIKAVDSSLLANFESKITTSIVQEWPILDGKDLPAPVGFAYMQLLKANIELMKMRMVMFFYDELTERKSLVVFD